MGNNNLTRKAIVYGANYGSRIIENLLIGSEAVAQGKSNIGHPYGALAYTALDLLGSVDAVKNSPYYKLAKIGGIIAYSGMIGSKLINFVQGDYSGVENLPFDISMAASLGYDLKQMGSDFGKNWNTKGLTFNLVKPK